MDVVNVRFHSYYLFYPATSRPAATLSARRARPSPANTASSSWRRRPRRPPTSRRPSSTRPGRYTTRYRRESLTSTTRYEERDRLCLLSKEVSFSSQSLCQLSLRTYCPGKSSTCECIKLTKNSTFIFLFQANGIKIGPQHSPANPNLPSGSQGGGSSGGCC